MAAYKNEIVLGNFVAKIIVEQESKHFASNGYDADTVHSNEPDKLFEVVLTDPTLEGLKKKVNLVIGGAI